MGERLLCKQEVIGSIPFTSTIQISDCRDQISELMGVVTEASLRGRSGHGDLENSA